MTTLAAVTDNPAFVWFGALSPLLLLAVGAWLKRRLDRATAEKTHAEADVSRATAEKTRAEGDSIVLANAKLLIEQAKAQQAERDAINGERLGVAQEKIRTLDGRLNRMEDHFARLRASLATHGVWDAAALVDLRAQKPEYPPPPVFPPAYPDHDHPDDIGDHPDDIRRRDDDLDTYSTRTRRRDTDDRMPPRPPTY